MTIPANIVTELASLQTQVQAATPLNAASRATITAIKLNTAQLIADMQAALTASSLLDTWTAPADVGAIVSGVLSVTTAAIDQNTLALKRGIVGRVASNINQVPS